jgi:ADP-ribosyl-[dinitrogen reductase] hydrolase
MSKLNTPEEIILGMRIGDALAMPVHWYYDTHRLVSDYGQVRDYLTPKNPHPDSILWRSSYTPLSPKAEILHEQVQYWGKRDVHYHQFLKAGENTLNVQLAWELWKSLQLQGHWDSENFLKLYIDFMTTPGRHRDTYVEECHRGFFNNYARGLAPQRCGVQEKHVAGLVFLFPVLAAYLKDPINGKSWALEQMNITHPGEGMQDAGRLMIRLFYDLIDGTQPKDAVEKLIASQSSRLLKGSWKRWCAMDTRRVITTETGPACYLEQAVPAILYILHQHGEDPETALIENTMAGGDNVHRGAVLGALLAASHGISKFPKRWLTGLVN